MVSTEVDGVLGGTEHRPAHAVLLWTVVGCWVFVVAWQIAEGTLDLRRSGPALVPWIAVIALTNLFPVKGWFAELTPDLPIFIAGALLLRPIEMALVGFLGAFDLREFRGEVGAGKALFNRSQFGLACMFGTLAAGAFRGSDGPIGSILVAAILALLVETLVDCILVTLFISTESSHSPLSVFGRLPIGSPMDFTLAFASWVVLGTMLASLYGLLHAIALFAFLVPTVVGRQMLFRSQLAIDRSEAYQSREGALAKITEDIYRERSDERHLIAADLHDEVLQPLYKVTLMAHVLKADLANGKLLELDEDLPGLLGAADIASTTLRNLIGELRRSTLGPGGFIEALRGLVEQLQAESRVRLIARLQEVHAAPELELVLYQIAKEALRNALSHANARTIELNLFETEGVMELSVRDDGVGFEPPLAMIEGHFGLQIMRERASSIGADLQFETRPGQGCLVVVRVERFD